MSEAVFDILQSEAARGTAFTQSVQLRSLYITSTLELLSLAFESNELLLLRSFKL